MTLLLLVVNNKIKQKNVGGRWRCIPCENFGEHLGFAMLKVGSRKTCSPVEHRASKRRKARRRINHAVARTLYPLVAAAVALARYSAVESSRLARGGAGEADLRCGGGEIERRRENNMAAAQVGRERAWGWVKFPAVGGFVQLPNHAASIADASDLAPRIRQNTRRTNFFAAPARIGHLLEDQIYLPALYTGSYYSTGA
jgi:hypothetical protein